MTMWRAHSVLDTHPVRQRGDDAVEVQRRLAVRQPNQDGGSA
jgi:hypothetical protein